MMIIIYAKQAGKVQSGSCLPLEGQRMRLWRSLMWIMKRGCVIEVENDGQDLMDIWWFASGGPAGEGRRAVKGTDSSFIRGAGIME
ncbi:hypothetical protein EAG_08705 [Camponotus floridanus]|uniref:Uncharacterized protein n=1 Tax=Camponotus floridanus TaxID=104421 RepID=E2A815_CAMFO|nr:hypothetical protein EAG_08705 [Camponotus floridanus]